MPLWGVHPLKEIFYLIFTKNKLTLKWDKDSIQEDNSAKITLDWQEIILLIVWEKNKIQVEEAKVNQGGKLNKVIKGGILIKAFKDNRRVNSLCKIFLTGAKIFSKE